MVNNLDKFCFEYGISIPQYNEDQNAIQKAMGVVEEEGLFALMVYLNSIKSDGSDNSDKLPEIIESNALKLLSDKNVDLIEGNFNINNFDDVEEKIKKLSGSEGDLDKLFLAKELVERMLVYARYHAKSKESK